MLTILLADDDTAFRNSIARALFSSHNVDFASNAEEEISLARQKKYDLIVTDNRMEDGHGNSGIYAIKHIRQFDSNVPIIILTSDSGMDVVIEALSKGASHYVQKPPNLDELRAVINNYVTL